MNEQETRRLKDGFISTIQKKVLSGELKPGDRLAPERELAQSFGMSRSSINQGILDLERSGFVRIVPRKGTFVADILEQGSAQTLIAIMNSDSSAYYSELLHDLLDTRILIERECSRLASCHMTREAAAQLWQRSDRILAAEKGELRDALYEYHLFLVQLAGNTVYKMIYQSFERTLKNLMQLHYEGTVEQNSNLPLYEALTKAVCAGDGEAAAQQMETILSKAAAYLMDESKRRSHQQ